MLPVEISCEAFIFHNLLSTFSGCSITYYHFINPSNYLNNASSREADLGELKLRFEQAPLLQLVISADFNSTYPAQNPYDGNPYKLSLCSVLVFPRINVQLSRDLTFSFRNYPYIHPSFIWFLKVFDQVSTPNHEASYLEAVKSHLPAIYLEIENFSVVSFICFPCITSGSTTDAVAIQFEESNEFGQLTVSSVRKLWTKLLTNLRGIRIGMDEQVDSNTSPKYFNKGHTTPCSIYPGKPELFSKHVCAVFVISGMLNFSIGARIAQTELHSILKLGYFVSRLALVLCKYSGFMASSHGIEVIEYGFVVFYDKNELLGQQLKLKGILAPFPWWTWIAVGAALVSTSLLVMTRIRTSIEQISLRSSIRWCLVLWSLMIEQGMTLNLGEDILARFSLWLVWATFGLIVSHAYRGFLFSTLASAENPSTPLTTSELVESHMLIGTSDLSWWGQNGIPVLKSSLTESMLPKIISSDSSSPIGKLRAELLKSLRLFTFKREFAEFALNTSVDRAAFVGPRSNIIPFPNLEILFSNLNPVLRMHSRKLDIPNRFGIIDPMWIIPQLKIHNNSSDL